MAKLPQISPPRHLLPFHARLPRLSAPIFRLWTGSAAWRLLGWSSAIRFPFNSAHLLIPFRNKEPSLLNRVWGAVILRAFRLSHHRHSPRFQAVSELFPQLLWSPCPKDLPFVLWNSPQPLGCCPTSRFSWGPVVLRAAALAMDLYTQPLDDAEERLVRL